MLNGIGDYDPPEDNRELITICYECSEYIREGDTYYEIMGIAICENCIEDFRKI